MRIKWLIFMIVVVIVVIGCSGQRQQSHISESNEVNYNKSKDKGKVVTSNNNFDPIESSAKENKMKIEEKPEAQLDAYIAKMSLDEKLGQLLFIAIRHDEQGNPITEVDEKVKATIKDYHVGGIILFKENINTTEQTQKLIRDLQKASGITLFIGVDEEGGSVSRVGNNKAINKVPFKEAFSIGQTGDTKEAYKEAKRMGKLLYQLGFNMNFAPVADLYNEPSNKVIGRRSFGTNAKDVTPMVIAFAKGLESEKMIPVVKHFPGHGNTKEDSHEGLAYINKTLKELEQEELIPFQEASALGIGGIMKGHLVAKALDEKNPVSLSEKWNAYLKKQFNTEEVLLMTDALNMGAIAKEYSVEEAAVLSIKAGNDILLMPVDLERTYKALKNAYSEGVLTEERLNQSVKKILSKKVSQKLMVLE